MNRPTISHRNDALLSQADTMLLTVKHLQPDLGLEQNSEARLAFDVNAYREAGQAFNASKTLRIKELYPEQSRLTAEARAFIGQTKNVLKPELGANWNPAWYEAGFVEQSIATPNALGEILTLVERLGIYLKAHPDMEVAQLRVTAAHAERIVAQFTKVRDAIANQETLEAELSATQKTTRSALRKRLRGLVNELGQLLADDDERWHTFGLVSPADRRESRRRNAKAKAEAIAAENGKAGLSPVEPVRQAA